MRYATVCSGVSAESLAWKPLGWECAFYSEVEAFPSAVLKHWYPEVDNLGDMKEIECGRYRGTVDVLCGGTPCQSFSVAGERGGMGDERGNLSLVFAQMAGELGVPWVVWENVPGVLSSGGGSDFEQFLRGLERCGYSSCWRVLDAQYFGVAQRRRRVFLVATSTGDWRRAAAVLFEQESLRGHFKKGGKAWEETANTPGSRSPRNIDPDIDGVGTYVTNIYGGNKRKDRPEGGMYVSDEETTKTLDQSGLNPTAQQGGTIIPEWPADVAPTLGTGWADRSAGSRMQEMVSQKGGHFVPDIANTIRPGAEGKQSVARSDGGINSNLVPTYWDGGQVSDTLDVSMLAKGQMMPEKRRFPCVTGNGVGIRRLTPRECERLMGFPDDYTLIPYKGKMASDTARYRAIGNSMAVPCVRWIGERIMMVEGIQEGGG